VSTRIFTDGSASGNPGPGGWAFLAYLEDRAQVVELGSHVPATTNNKMELRAAIEALRLCVKLKVFAQIFVYTDSKYVIQGITSWIFGWKKRNWIKADGQPVANREFWEELDSMIRQHSLDVKWVHVPGHAGVLGNERVDEIAVSFSHQGDPNLYDGTWEDFPDKEIFDNLRDVFKVSSYKKPKYLSLVKGQFYLHDTWEDCHAHVKGSSGAKFKKVKSYEEEQMLRKQWSK